MTKQQREGERERVKGKKKKKKKASRADQYELLVESSAGRILHFSSIRPSIHPSIHPSNRPAIFFFFSFLFPPTPKSREIQKRKEENKREKNSTAHKLPAQLPAHKQLKTTGPAAPSLEMST
jgi:hypothetical protein